MRIMAPFSEQIEIQLAGAVDFRKTGNAENMGHIILRQHLQRGALGIDHAGHFIIPPSFRRGICHSVQQMP